MMNSRWANFTRAEFDCNCGCEGNEMLAELIDALQHLRTIIGQPFIITSGYRCPQHPIEAAKSEPGTHSLGTAADVAAGGMLARAIVRHALQIPGWTGVGINQKGDKRFIHLDRAVSDPPRVRPAFWTYD